VTFRWQKVKRFWYTSPVKPDQSKQIERYLKCMAIKKNFWGIKTNCSQAYTNIIRDRFYDFCYQKGITQPGSTAALMFKALKHKGKARIRRRNYRYVPGTVCKEWRRTRKGAQCQLAMSLSELVSHGGVYYMVWKITRFWVYAADQGPECDTEPQVFETDKLLTIKRYYARFHSNLWNQNMRTVVKTVDLDAAQKAHLNRTLTCRGFNLMRQVWDVGFHKNFCNFKISAAGGTWNIGEDQDPCGPIAGPCGPNFRYCYADNRADDQKVNKWKCHKFNRKYSPSLRHLLPAECGRKTSLSMLCGPLGLGTRCAHGEDCYNGQCRRLLPMRHNRRRRVKSLKAINSGTLWAVTNLRRFRHPRYESCYYVQVSKPKVSREYDFDMHGCRVTDKDKIDTYKYFTDNEFRTCLGLMHDFRQYTTQNGHYKCTVTLPDGKVRRI